MYTTKHSNLVGMLVIGIVLIMQIFMCVILFYDRAQISTEKLFLQKQVYDLQKEAKEIQRSEKYCVKTSARYL